MPCLKESTLQGYLEEFGPSPFRQMVESRLASCARCRTAFDRVATTHRRVNSWLSKLSSPTESHEIDATCALARVLSRIEPDDHLARLLAPDTEIPWFQSIYWNLRDLIRPEKLPPLELTSQAVAVSDIWGKGTNPKAFATSVIFQGAVVALLMLIGTNDAVRTRFTQMTLIAPPPVAKARQIKTNQGGGGGQHSPLPPLKGQLPKPVPRVFTVPLVTVEHPVLVMDASLIAPPDAWAAPTGPIGNPFSALGGSGGPGGQGGVGGLDGRGIGGSYSDGAGDRADAGIFSVGNGTTRPEVLTRVDPEYSEEARKAKYSGAVMLSIVVNTDGRAANIKIVKSLGMGLDEKAVEAVQKWLFRPGMNKGVPVKVRAQIEVNFRLL